MSDGLLQVHINWTIMGRSFLFLPHWAARLEPFCPVEAVLMVLSTRDGDPVSYQQLSPAPVGPWSISAKLCYAN